MMAQFPGHNNHWEGEWCCFSAYRLVGDLGGV
jgi:hypothetical protein